MKKEIIKKSSAETDEVNKKNVNCMGNLNGNPLNCSTQRVCITTIKIPVWDIVCVEMLKNEVQVTIHKECDVSWIKQQTALGVRKPNKKSKSLMSKGQLDIHHERIVYTITDLNKQKYLEGLPYEIIGEYLGKPTSIIYQLIQINKTRILKFELHNSHLEINYYGKKPCIKREWSDLGFYKSCIDRACTNYLDKIIRKVDAYNLIKECKDVLYKERQEALSKNPMIYHEDNLNYLVYCPICCSYFRGSDYLLSEFKGDERTLWLANMVTHYRHGHITSWNKCWGWGGRYYREAAHFGDYDTEKAIVNERAKRQIARKGTAFLVKNNISVEVFNRLQGTTTQTQETVSKVLGKFGQKI